jgi:hypothetical protein
VALLPHGDLAGPVRTRAPHAAMGPHWNRRAAPSGSVSRRGCGDECPCEDRKFKTTARVSGSRLNQSSFVRSVTCWFAGHPVSIRSTSSRCVPHAHIVWPLRASGNPNPNEGYLHWQTWQRRASYSRMTGFSGGAWEPSGSLHLSSKLWAGCMCLAALRPAAMHAAETPRFVNQARLAALGAEWS